jgi:hypothetical protein
MGTEDEVVAYVCVTCELFWSCGGPEQGLQLGGERAFCTTRSGSHDLSPQTRKLVKDNCVSQAASPGPALRDPGGERVLSRISVPGPRKVR